jgi:hypothetical protein
MARQFSFDSHSDRKQFRLHHLDLNDPATSKRYNMAVDDMRSILAKKRFLRSWQNRPS